MNCRNCGADLTASGVRGPYCSTGPDSCEDADRDDDRSAPGMDHLYGT